MWLWEGSGPYENKCNFTEIQKKIRRLRRRTFKIVIKFVNFGSCAEKMRPPAMYRGSLAERKKKNGPKPKP